MAKKPTGIVIYRGPSLFNGEPIVAIATSVAQPSKNAKTGEMVQIWILADRAEHPLTSNRLGFDLAVCGICPLKGIANALKTKGYADGRVCYVDLAKAVASIHKAFRAGRYPAFDAVEHGHLFDLKAVRFGAYGDPAMVPAEAWSPVFERAARWTGYTHQRGTTGVNADSRFMTSADSLVRAQAAWSRGERTFRVIGPDESLQKNEIFCPATPEGGMKATCATCGLCSGSRLSKAKSVAVVVHGAGARNFTTVGA